MKDKLCTRSVASGEFVDAEAFLLSEKPSGPQRQAGPSNGKGLGRMMELTNAARLGIALFGLANARRALVESLCYARQREAFGSTLIDKPLMRRKLVELIVDVEAAQAMVFDGTGAANHRQPKAMRQRIAVPVTKLAGALLIEQAAWERETRGSERKALVAALYARRYLADHGPLRGIDADTDEALERFGEDGALRLQQR